MKVNLISEVSYFSLNDLCNITLSENMYFEMLKCLFEQGFERMAFSLSEFQGTVEQVLDLGRGTLGF